MFVSRTANYIMDIDIPDIVISAIHKFEIPELAILVHHIRKSCCEKREKETNGRQF
jgi:hypothetical protein